MNEIEIKDLIEHYCDRTRVQLPHDQESFGKVASRMRAVGLLTDAEQREMVGRWESIKKELKAG